MNATATQTWVVVGTDMSENSEDTGTVFAEGFESYADADAYCADAFPPEEYELRVMTATEAAEMGIE